MIAQAVRKLESIGDDGRDESVVAAHTSIRQAVDMARLVVEHGGRPDGVPTGLADVDGTLGGLFPGELIVLAARLGSGKSVFGAQVMAHNAIAGRPVLFASIEMSAAQLATRILFGAARVDGGLLRTGKLGEDALQQMEAAALTLADAKFYILDRGSIQTDHIRREARRMNRNEGLGLIIVDYIQKLTPSDSRAKRHEAVAQNVHRSESS